MIQGKVTLCSLSFFPLKETYPSWNYPFKLDHLDFLFQQDSFRSLKSLCLPIKNVCFSRLWNTGAENKDCHCFLATSNQQTATATICSIPSYSRYNTAEQTSLSELTRTQSAPLLLFLCWPISCISYCPLSKAGQIIQQNFISMLLLKEY